MVEQKGFDFHGTMKKRSREQAFLPEEMSNRFRSKADFLRYFRESRKCSSLLVDPP